MIKRRDAMSWGLVASILLLIGAAVFYVVLPQLQPHVTLRIGDGVFSTRVAKTQVDRDKSLSGTSALRQDQALLLIYDSDAKWPIQMKDMNYPIDIVWLNKDKVIVYIVKNAPPDTYPYEQFMPKQNARYVLELPAGTIEQKTIIIGASASFDENHLEGWGT